MGKFEIRVEMAGDNDRARNIQARRFPVTLVSGRANPALKTIGTLRTSVEIIRYPVLIMKTSSIRSLHLIDHPRKGMAFSG